MAQKRRAIVAATVRHHLPVLAPFRDFIAAGATVSYGIDVVDEFIRAAGLGETLIFLNRAAGGHVCGIPENRKNSLPALLTIFPD